MRSDWLFWNQYAMQGFGHGLAVSYDIEVVSFPFVPDCMTDAIGCGTNNPNLGRNLNMPTTQYTTATASWGFVKRQISPTKFGTIGSSLSSFVYAIDIPLFSNPVRNMFPHTILKHTINIHCELNSIGNPITPPIYKFSWLHDNTRGRMKYYPFCPNGDINCNESQYDVCFNPRILHKSPTHAFNETQTNAILSGAGTINYFDYNDIINSNCNLSPVVTMYPLPHWLFYNNGYRKAYFPPHTLVTAPLYQSEGRTIAGYEIIPNNSIEFQRMYGVKQNYFINTNILLHVDKINMTDYIIYNPSDVTITADNLLFYSPYSYRTIRGVYPTPSEVLADDIAINGGPYGDSRKVPVRTDLRCEDATFPHDALNPDDSKYASLYRLASGSMVTLKPCVKVFDAAFILHPNSVLVLDNKPSIIGLHRVAIDRLGGRLIEKYDLNNGTFYLQNKTETAIAPNSYIVNAKIVAGENVDASQTAGPYIASTGTSLELIAKEYVKLEHGFKAEAGSAVKIFVDPSLVIPICPLSGSGGSGNRMVNNNAEQLIISATAHIKLMPSVFLESTGIYSEKEDDLIVGVDVYDITGKLIHRTSNILSNYFELSIPQVNEGIYFVKIKTQQNVKIIKVLKQ